jgi:SAM-dependent methyltransferase
MPSSSGQEPVSAAEYSRRVEAERKQFDNDTDVHGLPRICFYWLNRYILPQLLALGYADADQFFRQNLARAYHGSGSSRPASRVRRFLSIGAGNCDTEIRLALALRESGANEFVIDCLDLNEQMLERAKAAASASGVASHIEPICGDFNHWQPTREYDAVIANHALHHVLRLEALFDAIRDSLRPGGSLIVSDMVGRNGHRRWPEALEPVERFWSELPERFRYNRLLRRQETQYPDWDCSADGFEGIRCQDILPLLLERFGFEFFYAFSNVIAPFVDRCYGRNFDPDAEWDRSFVDRVHAFDESEILAGRIKPTIMLAVLKRERSTETTCLKHLTPEFCTRWP